MKSIKTILLICSAVLAISATSCRKTGVTIPDGKVSFVLSASPVVADVAVKSNVSDFVKLPETSNFTITVYGSGNSIVWSGLYSECPATLSLPAGNYTAKASYGNIENEGASCPCFAGEKTFAVEGEKLTQVSISAELQNAVIRESCTQNFKNYFTSYSFTVKSGAGTEFIFGTNENAVAFIDPWKITVSGTLVNQGGTQQTFGPVEFSNLQPATCYILKFDASGVSGSTISITFNNETVTTDLGEIELN